MFIFVRLQNCVKWHMDTCLSVQNTQMRTLDFSGVHNGFLPFPDGNAVVNNLFPS